MIDFTKDKIKSSIIYFVVPLFVGNIIQNLFFNVESIIVGRGINESALASLGVTFPIIFTIISFIVGLSFGFNIIISQYYGAKDYEKVQKVIDNINTLILITAIFLTIICSLLKGFFVSILSTPYPVSEYARQYLGMYFLGFYFFFGYNINLMFLRAIGDSKTSLFFILFSTLLNIILLYIFIISLRLDIRFVALSSIISQGVTYIVSIIFINKKVPFFKINLFSFSLDVKLIKQSVKVSLPTALQQLFIALSSVVIVGIVNNLGVLSISAYTIAYRAESLILMPIMNISYTLMVFVSQNIGNQNYERIEEGYNFVKKLSFALTFLFSVLFIIFGYRIGALFTTNEEIRHFTKTYFYIVPVFYVVFNYMFNNNAVLRGAGYTLVPMLITLFSLWVLRIPSAYFLSKYIGFMGICFSIPISWVAGSILSYYFYRKDKWKEYSVVKNKISSTKVDQSIIEKPV
ncbi:MAG: MATE family efflux transporter [Bacteroidales bacterium]|nr:MATE family efflux transporter [Bacteroidales bacterium]